MRRTLTLVGALFLGLLTVLIAFVLGMRARSPRLLNAIRRTNRAIFNPLEMKSAGMPGWTSASEFGGPEPGGTGALPPHR